MKKICIFLSALLLHHNSLALFCSHKPLEEAKGPVVIVVPVPYQTPAMNFNNHFVQSQQANPHQTTLVDTCTSCAKHAREFLACNAKTIILAASTAACASILYTALRGNTYLADNTLWSNWHTELTLERLITIPQQDLARELHLYMHTRFVNYSVTTTYNSPQEAFLAEITQELANLRYYHTFYSWCTWAHCTWLLPIDKKAFEQLPERIQKAAYLKTIFTTHNNMTL